jgi:peptidyl-prolyl cis-trans isomerase D
MVLQSIRDRLTGIIAIFIFAILIIPFAFVGVSSYFTSDAVNAVAVVNDQEITINEFNTDFQNYRRRMQAQLGASFDPDLFDQLIIRRQFLDQMIDQELMAQVSIDAGLAVDNQRLAQAIRDIEGFQVDGEFNADVYQARLTAQGITPQQFDADMRASMVMNQFPSSIADSAITTNWEVNDYVRLIDQQRAFKAIIVPAFPQEPEEETDAEAETTDPETVEDTEEEVVAEEEATEEAVEEEIVEEEIPDEEAILAWYEAHQGDYMSQEMVTIEYLELDAATMGGSVDVEEDILLARFEQQGSRFVTPESRLASHILIEVDSSAPEVDIETARQQAEDLAERVKAGEDFGELAIEHSQDVGSASEGGDLGWVEPGFMVQAFEDGLYELSMQNPVSDPVQTGFGWHVIQLREIRPSEGMTFTEAREILLEEYKTEADERRFLEQADRMVDIIYEDPTTLEAAAEELGLEVLEAGPFGRQGGELGISANMEVVNTAFSDLVLAQGVISDPINLGLNHIALILLKEHLPEAQLPLEEVRDQVVESVRRERAMEAASATADELLASLDGGTDILTLAESSGLELVEAEAARRTSPEIDARLREQVFLLQGPEDAAPVRTVVELAEGYAVVQLDSVTQGELAEEDEARKQAYMRRISNASASTETLGFVRMLREQSTIEVYEDRL